MLFRHQKTILWCFWLEGWQWLFGSVPNPKILNKDSPLCIPPAFSSLSLSLSLGNNWVTRDHRRCPTQGAQAFWSLCLLSQRQQCIHMLSMKALSSQSTSAFSHDPHNDKGPSLESSLYPFWPYPFFWATFGPFLYIYHIWSVKAGPWVGVLVWPLGFDGPLPALLEALPNRALNVTYVWCLKKAVPIIVYNRLFH